MRRIAALIISNLLCELVEQQLGANPSAGSRPFPFAVSLVELDRKGGATSLPGLPAQRVSAKSVPTQSDSSKRAASNSVELNIRSVLSAVNPVAITYGIKTGQTIAEARAKVAGLQVFTVTTEQVQQALGRVAESVFRFGTTLSIEVPDTVWIDITGVAHLFGGEEELLGEMACTVRELGHSVRVVAASGVRLSQAFARFSSPVRERGVFAVPDSAVTSWVHALPLQALPVELEVKTWLGQLGIFQLGELAKIPTNVSSSRLGKSAREALELLQGSGQEPLIAYKPLELLAEQWIWEDAIEALEPIRFALRRLVGLIAKRLEGRGLAAQKARLTVLSERAHEREDGSNPVLDFDLATPLYKEEDLLRVFDARLSKLELSGPCLGLKLEVFRMVPAATRQLSLEMLSSRLELENPERLDVLVSELSADIGAKNFGVLRLVDTHFPEKLSVLTPLSATATPARSKATRSRKVQSNTVQNTVQQPSWRRSNSEDSLKSAMQVPTRLFSPAIPIAAALRTGAILSIGLNVYVIEHLEFEKRVDTVEWWSGNPSARDYVRLWLTGTEHCLVALAYVDRVANRRYLQAVYD